MFAKNSIEHLYSHFKFGDANYEKKEDCDWHIVTNIGMKIYLKFITFELEHEANCSYDFVEIFDGDDDNSPSLGKFCGNQVKLSESLNELNSNFEFVIQMPTDMISSSESILIRFRTDDSIHNKGFTLIYSAVETIENELINAIDSNKSIEKSIRKTQQSFLNEKNNNYLSKYLSINEDQQDDFLLP